MDISGFGTLITPLASSIPSSGASGAGAAAAQIGDRLSLSFGARVRDVAARNAGALEVETRKAEEAKSPVAVVQRAVTSTAEYLQNRLEKLIGGLRDGKFAGALAEEMEDLAEAMQKAQDQGDGARALRLLRDQGGKLGEALAPELDALLTDTRDYFTQALTTAFGSLRIIDPTGKSIGQDLLSLGAHPDVDVETAAALVKKYDFIPESSKLKPLAAGEGVLYETQSDPTLRDLFDSIQASFNEELDRFFGNPETLAASLEQGFLDQGKALFFKERADGSPDMAQALGSALDSLLEGLTGDAGVRGLARAVDTDVREAVEHFQPQKGYLTTLAVVRELDALTETAAETLDALREIVRKAQEQAKAGDQEQGGGQVATDVPAAAGSGGTPAPEGAPASVDLLV